MGGLSHLMTVKAYPPPSMSPRRCGKVPWGPAPHNRSLRKEVTSSGLQAPDMVINSGEPKKENERRGGFLIAFSTGPLCLVIPPLFLPRNVMVGRWLPDDPLILCLTWAEVQEGTA